jgi:hypothetical protein
MPDLTIEIMQQCAHLEYEVIPVQGSHGTYSVTFEASERTGELVSCTCPGFKFRRDCKHIAEAAKKHCTWHELYGEAQEQDGVCPECGGPTRSVRVAV